MVAYSTDSVRREFHRLIAIIDAETRDHRNELSEIQRASDGMNDVTERIGAEMESGHHNEESWDLLKSYVERQGSAGERIGEECNLNADRLKRVCEAIITEARKDLRGSA